MSEPTDVPPGGDFVPPLTPAYTAPSMPDLTDLVEGSSGRKDPKPASGASLGRGVIIGGVIGALVIAGGAFVAGRATAAGPATLADALAQAQAGTLPCGTPSGTGGGQFLLTRLCGSGAAGGQAGGPGAGPGGGQGGGLGGPGGFGRGVFGQVSAVTATSITVTTRAGDVTVAVPASVAVNKTVSGSLSDVTVGSNVTVASTSDASGNRTATSITLVPAGQFPGGPGDGGTPPSPPAG
jgi:hypothetical protein